jgi:hypothetical protein
LFFLLNDQKKEPKKNRPPACGGQAGEKLPKIHSQWRQELQQERRLQSWKAFVTSNSCCRHCSEFFNGNFSQAGSFLNSQIIIRFCFPISDYLNPKK